MRLLKYLRELFSFICKGEISNALYKVSDKMPNWLFRFNKACMMYTEKFDPPEIKNPDIRIKIATIADLDDIIRISGLGGNKIKSMLDSGVSCFLASVGNNPPASVSWGASGKCFIKGLGFKYDFGDDGTYGFWAATVPEARGKGLHFALMIEKDRYNKALGRVISYSIIETLNKLSYDMRIKTGFRPMLKIYHLKLFCLKISYVKNLSEKTSKLRCFIKEPFADNVVI